MNAPALRVRRPGAGRTRHCCSRCRSSVRARRLVDFVIRLAAFGLFATSLNLLVGYGGMVSFGHGMFYGLGAYCFALLMQNARHPDSGRLRLDAAS